MNWRTGESAHDLPAGSLELTGELTRSGLSAQQLVTSRRLYPALLAAFDQHVEWVANRCQAPGGTQHLSSWTL